MSSWSRLRRSRASAQTRSMRPYLASWRSRARPGRDWVMVPVAAASEWTRTATTPISRSFARQRRDLVVDGSWVLEMAGEPRVDGRADGSGRVAGHVSPGSRELELPPVIAGCKRQGERTTAAVPEGFDRKRARRTLGGVRGEALSGRRRRRCGARSGARGAMRYGLARKKLRFSAHERVFGNGWTPPVCRRGPFGVIARVRSAPASPSLSVAGFPGAARRRG